MSGDPQHHQQRISRVSVQQSSRAYVGTFNNCDFGKPEESQNALKQAAIECRNALFLTDPDVDRERLVSAKGTRVAGTCEWITHNASYRAWLNGDSDTRLLWISGGPGKGKTMLSVFLTEVLETETSVTEDTELIYYFCSYQDDKCNTGVTVLRGLVHQIIAKYPHLTKHALPYFGTPERTQQTVSSLETLWVIFEKIVKDSDLGNVFCVLDGLDECDQGTLRILVPKLVRLLGPQASSLSVTTTFRLVIISRDISGLQGCVRVRLEPDNNRSIVSDIERFISTRVGELSRIEGFNDSVRTALQNRLLARADGTFLWVGFAMHELLQKQTCTEVIEVLDNFPSGLPAVYRRMLLQIPNGWRQKCCMIIRWVTMAQRPLNLLELAEAVGIRASHPLITKEQAIRDAIVHCGPLIKVQEQEVELIHQSAQEYLLKECHNDPDLSTFKIEPEKTHLELARTCLDRVLYMPRKYKALKNGDAPSLQNDPLLQYAVCYWPEHLRCCPGLSAELIDTRKGFFGMMQSRRAWWAVYNEEKKLYLPSPLPELHMACYLGIIPWVEKIFCTHWGYNKYFSWQRKRECFQRQIIKYGGSSHEKAIRNRVLETNYGLTELQWAARGGHAAVMQMLIDTGADIYNKGQDGTTVLDSAAVGGNEEVVRLLLDNGMNVNMVDDTGWTALRSAAGRGNETVVRLLLERGADVTIKNNLGETALHGAVIGGSEAVVQLLLNKGAEINTKTIYGKTALDLAVEGGNEAVARLLLGPCAETEVRPCETGCQTTPI